MATRRSAACSSASRPGSTRCFARGSASRADVPIASSYPIIGAVSTSRTRVVLADDDVLLREGLAGLLERSGFEVVGQSGTPSERATELLASDERSSYLMRRIAFAEGDAHGLEE